MLAATVDKYPKAVNIIRPGQQHHYSDWLHQPYSTSLDSSCTFSTASTISTTTQPIIHHVPNEVYTDPGLSFFCQKGPYNNPPSLLFEKHTPKPLVLNRIDLKKSSPPQVNLDNTSILDVDDDDDDQEQRNTTPPLTPPPFFGLNRSFKPGLSSILTLNKSHQQLEEEARMNRKIEDLEIENKSLLTLNENLEFVVKQQKSTISDLRKRLEAIEEPLTPGLNISYSKKGIMSIADVSESPDIIGSEEDIGEDVAFERVRHKLLQLVEQGQSAMSHKVLSRVISRRGSTATADEQTKSTVIKNNKARIVRRRDSLLYSPPSLNRSPQRSLSRSSSPTSLSNTEIRPSSICTIRSIRYKTTSTQKWK